MSDTLCMKPSRVLAKIRAGKPAFSTKINSADPRIVEIAALSGFDCIWLDREHCANDLRVIEEQIRAAAVHGADSIVRVARGSYSEHIWPLEMNATAIMVPHLMSLEDAKWVARITKFHPLGRRPMDSGNADGAYAAIPTAEYVKQANEQRFIVCQIEDPEPLEELDKIAQVPGIDMLYFGPADFAHALGIPGKMDDPRIMQARLRVAEVCKRHGKLAGTVCAGGEQIRHLIDMGYLFLNLGADVLGLWDYWRKVQADIREHVE
jgi:4-hydroxy-2-oxoheptanedioate aldolase